LKNYTIFNLPSRKDQITLKEERVYKFDGTITNIIKDIEKM